MSIITGCFLFALFHPLWRIAEKVIGENLEIALDNRIRKCKIDFVEVNLEEYKIERKGRSEEPMPRYTVIVRSGHDREERTDHRTWSAAMNRARSAGANKDEVEVIESDRDGRRCYDWDGDILWRE
jgi:hypothetical protein